MQMLKVVQLFYPQQVVQSNPDFDAEGDPGGTAVSVQFEVQPIEDEPGIIAAVLSVEIDQGNSTNPPYFFKLDAYGVFQAEYDDSMEAKVKFTMFSILGGAIRERLVELTSRAPWGNFMLQPLPLPKTVQEVGSIPPPPTNQAP